MDLVSLAVGLQQSKIIGEAQILVASKILQAQKQQGDAAVKLIQAAETGVNSAGNSLVAAAGLGGQLDVNA